MNYRKIGLFLACLLSNFYSQWSLTGPVTAYARDYIQMAGSSTVLPYAKIVAEAFGDSYKEYKFPVVESGGTGAGIKEFCRGIGNSTIDIVNASRPMKQSELQMCVNSAKIEVIEAPIGYDAIVFATNKQAPKWSLTPRDIYQALAAQHNIDGKLQPNRIMKWSDIQPQFPDWEIEMYIPGEKHGTREVFEEKLMLAGCKESGTFDQLQAQGFTEKAATEACIAIRKDGKVTAIDGDYSETIARVLTNKTSIGVFSLPYYENNTDRLKLVELNNIVPTLTTISNGDYPISRPLFLYIKKAHIETIPGLKEYIGFFLSESMIGPDGPLADYGLVPLSESDRETSRMKFTKGQVMALQ